MDRMPKEAGGLAVAGAALGIVAGLVELTVGPSIRSWVGDKQDTTGLGIATMLLSAIALAAAIGLLRRPEASAPLALLLIAGLVVPAAICFTTVGRLWYLPGALLVAAAVLAAAGLRRPRPSRVGAGARPGPRRGP